MRQLLLHYPSQQFPDMLLQKGKHFIVSDKQGVVQVVVKVVQDMQLLAHLHLDERGLWLLVGKSAGGAHVNGRPIQYTAMLRAGDNLHIRNQEIQILGTKNKLTTATVMRILPIKAVFEKDPRILLRSVGAQHYGRSFVIDSVLTVGANLHADIQLDNSASVMHHSTLERHGTQVLLRGLTDAETHVNGVAVQHAWLEAGDQVVFTAKHRYVLEVPMCSAKEDEANAKVITPQVALAINRWVKWRLWLWLLLSAVLLGSLMSALFWFGASI